MRLRTGKSNVISLALSTESDIMDHTARLISSIAGGLRNTTCHPIGTPYFPSEDPMKPVRCIVETESADAAILNQTQPEDPRIAYMMERGFPFATRGRTDWCSQHAFFGFDNAARVRIGAEMLIARGRRNLMMIAPPPERNYARAMVDGAMSGLGRSGESFAVMEGANSNTSSHDTRRAAERVRRRSGHPVSEPLPTSDPDGAGRRGGSRRASCQSGAAGH